MLAQYRQANDENVGFRLAIYRSELLMLKRKNFEEF